jgi:ankyrin repeat protein
VDEAWLDELPPLVRAAATGDDREVERLLACGADPNEADTSGWTALHAAATRNHVDVVHRLLSWGADVDARAEHGFTPLLNAAAAGHLVIEALLAAGADATAQESRLGWRPLDRFADHANAAGIELVLKAGADVDAEDFSGGTALASAAEAGCEECVELLPAAGADAARTWDGESPADLAREQGFTRLAERLTRAATSRH